MAAWFIFALASAVFTGGQSFLNKVAAERQHDSYYVNAVASITTALLSAILFLISADQFSAIPKFIYWLGLLSAILYTARTITQLEALQFIDAAIFFPLYKVIGPIIVTAIGVFFLKDMLSPTELVGIILSCLVPLLLITRAEHLRQKNLSFGLMLMLASTVLAALTAASNAYAVHSQASLILPFMVVAYGFSSLIGIVIYVRRYQVRELYTATRAHSRSAFLTGLGIGVFQIISFYFFLLAFAGGDLSVVYSINAHYIVIPVILSVWLYREHWNKQKAFALVVSLLALILLHR